MKKPLIVLLLFFVLSACSSFAQPGPTVVPMSTEPVIVTAAPGPTPASIALGPTEIREQPASATPQFAAWNGIPIMPGATTGEGDEEGYVFTIAATSLQIREYYELELGKLGWQPIPEEDDDASVLMFMNSASERLTISIISKGDEALVLLVK